MNFESVLLACDTPRSTPRYTGPETANVAAFLWYRPDGSAAALLVDQCRGTSVTNAAEAIMAFLLRQHTGRRGYPWNGLSVAYRDSEGQWDQLALTGDADGRFAGVDFRPLGDRTLDDALRFLAAVGVTPSPAERALIQQAVNCAGAEAA
ncbi:hypothetical protein QU487_06670 [Crenobacter sp. SG2305]|uniref:hypothetical protein n=1 Tax=Crenobacter oryzisoli TaxID=3056844 RepID=UPI0025AB3317|nr:hypothetical protein [Crenobacter sp. SG2305]MDN0082437.1 hypothetical protein [Crenobacter sp. SG2305]